ncbi:MAG: hypothetical protein ACM309_00660 [Bacillota bacterium]
MYFSIKDSFRQAVEAASGGKNTVLYNQYGQPIVVVIVPMFRLADIDSSWPADPHPAFIVNGVIKKEIYIAKYQAVLENGRALSLPGQDPAVYVNFDQARNACIANGPGWHLMTNAEWAAIALWCWKNGLMPKGNNYAGTDVDDQKKFGRETYTWAYSSNWNGRAYKFDGTNYLHVGRVATGSGPASWSHDGTPDGIYDLNGNVWEWQDGLKLHDGKIYVHGTGGAAMNNFQTANNSHDVTGWLDTGAFFDCTVAGDATQTSHEIGDPILSPDRTNPMYTADPTSDAYYAYSAVTFESLAAESGFTILAMLKYLAVAPPGAGLGGDILYVRNYGERLPIRGGNWADGSNAGVFALTLNNARSHSADSIGFRAAFIPV